MRRLQPATVVRLLALPRCGSEAACPTVPARATGPLLFPGPPAATASHRSQISRNEPSTEPHALIRTWPHLLCRRHVVRAAEHIELGSCTPYNHRARHGRIPLRESCGERPASPLPPADSARLGTACPAQMSYSAEVLVGHELSPSLARWARWTRRAWPWTGRTGRTDGPGWPDTAFVAGTVVAAAQIGRGQPSRRNCDGLLCLPTLCVVKLWSRPS